MLKLSRDSVLLILTAVQKQAEELHLKYSTSKFGYY